MDDQSQGYATYFETLDDPEFLAAHRCVREELERTSRDVPGRAELDKLLDQMNEEFDRRARAAWQS